MVKKQQRLSKLDKAKIRYYTAENTLYTVLVNLITPLIGKVFLSRSHTHSHYYYFTGLIYFGIGLKGKTLEIQLAHEGGPDKNIHWATIEEGEMSIEDFYRSDLELKEITIQEFQEAFTKATNSKQLEQLIKLK